MEEGLSRGFVFSVMTFSREVSEAMRSHAERAWPAECVGALLGADEVLLALPLHNVAPNPRAHFELSARDYLAAEREAEARGLTVRGYYHSHPQGPAEPSAEDAAHAQPGQWTVIIPVYEGVAAAPRAFRFEGAAP